MDDRQLGNFLENLDRRLKNLEGTVRRLESQEGRWNVTNALHPVSTNLSNIREMFLLEILRQKGILDGIDLASIESKVREELVGDHVPWGASKNASEENIKSVLNEIADNYAANNEDD